MQCSAVQYSKVFFTYVVDRETKFSIRILALQIKKKDWNYCDEISVPEVRWCCVKGRGVAQVHTEVVLGGHGYD